MVAENSLWEPSWPRQRGRSAAMLLSLQALPPGLESSPRCRIFLNQDDMLEHRVSAGDCLLLSLPGRVPESGGDLPSPSASDASPGPGSRSRRRQSAQQQAAASGLRLRAVQDVSPVPSPSGAARTAARDGDPTARPDGPSDLLALAADRYALQVPSAWAMTAEASESTSGGRRFVAGSAWPCGRVGRGGVALSPPLVASLADPAPGTTLAALPAVPAPATIPPCQRVVLRLLLPQTDTDTEPSPSTPATGALPPPSPMTPGAAVGTRGPGSNPATAMKTSGVAGTPQLPTPANVTKRAVRPSLSLAPRWLLRLASQESPASAGAATGADADVGAGDRALLSAVVSAHVRGRLVMPGTVVAVPILGFLANFLIESSVHASNTPGQRGGDPMQPPDASRRLGAAQGAATADAAVAALGEVGWGTVVSVVLPGEDDGPGEGAKADAPQGDQALRALSDTGAEAARRAVGTGSGADAAASAARAAVAAGWAAGGTASSQCLGGMADVERELHRLVAVPLTRPGVMAGLGLGSTGGVMLFGPPGTGKTSVARAVAAQCGAAMLVVNGPELLSQVLGDSEAGVRGVFAAARALSPAVVFLDELDSLAPNREAGASGPAARVVSALAGELDALGADPGARVVVVAATNRPDAVDAALRRPGRLDREVEVGVPGPAARREILEAHLRGMRHSLSPGDVTALADSTHGYVGADLAALCSEAAMHALRRVVSRMAAGSDRGSAGVRGWAGQAGEAEAVTEAVGRGELDNVGLMSGGECVGMDDMRFAETRVRPSALKEMAVEVPRVRWSDVGGLDTVKQALREAVEWPVRRAADLARLGADAPRGILLYGPPGCSKTLLARAVASETEMNFLAVKGPELFSKYVGDTERAVAALFHKARQAAPCIVFLDEVDGLAGARGTGDDGARVGDRVLSQLLSEIDGLHRAPHVFVLAATNRPDNIDAALLRPGRLDRLIYVAPPDEPSRRDILAVHLRSKPVSLDVRVEDLARQTAGYTGADLAALCREAALAALEETLDAMAIEPRHFDVALTRVPPSAPSPPALLTMYARFQRGAGTAGEGSPYSATTPGQSALGRTTSEPVDAKTGGFSETGGFVTGL